MKRTALKRGTPLRRTGWLRSRPKRRIRVDADVWREDLGPCVICPAEGGACSGPVQGHHAVTQQALRKRGLDAFLSDRRNRVPVCEFRHEQHTTRFKPIPLALLPDSVFEFAAELGLYWYLERFYTADPDEAVVA